MGRSKKSPDYIFKRFSNIIPEFISTLGIEFLIIDIDNTLALADVIEPQPGVKEWIESIQKLSIKIVFLSNNTRYRVEKFSEQFSNIEGVWLGAKPLKIRYKQLMRKYGFKKEKTATIGDQVFTDIWGGNRAGITTILVEPFEPKTEGGWFFRLKRRLERRYVKNFEDI